MTEDQIVKKLAAFSWLDATDPDSLCSGLVAIGVRPSEFHARLDHLATAIAVERFLAADFAETLAALLEPDPLMTMAEALAADAQKLIDLGVVPPPSIDEFEEWDRNHGRTH